MLLRCCVRLTAPAQRVVLTLPGLLPARASPTKCSESQWARLAKQVCARAIGRGCGGNCSSSLGEDQEAVRFSVCARVHAVTTSAFCSTYATLVDALENVSCTVMDKALMHGCSIRRRKRLMALSQPPREPRDGLPTPHPRCRWIARPVLSGMRGARGKARATTGFCMPCRLSAPHSSRLSSQRDHSAEPLAATHAPDSGPPVERTQPHSPAGPSALSIAPVTCRIMLTGAGERQAQRANRTGIPRQSP